MAGFGVPLPVLAEGETVDPALDAGPVEPYSTPLNQATATTLADQWQGQQAVLLEETTIRQVQVGDVVMGDSTSVAVDAPISLTGALSGGTIPASADGATVSSEDILFEMEILTALIPELFPHTPVLEPMIPGVIQPAPDAGDWQFVTAETTPGDMEEPSWIDRLLARLETAFNEHAGTEHAWIGLMLAIGGWVYAIQDLVEEYQYVPASLFVPSVRQWSELLRVRPYLLEYLANGSGTGGETMDWVMRRLGELRKRLEDERQGAVNDLAAWDERWDPVMSAIDEVLRNDNVPAEDVLNRRERELRSFLAERGAISMLEGGWNFLGSPNVQRAMNELRQIYQKKALLESLDILWARRLALQRKVDAADGSPHRQQLDTLIRGLQALRLNGGWGNSAPLAAYKPLFEALSQVDRNLESATRELEQNQDRLAGIVRSQESLRGQLNGVNRQIAGAGEDLTALEQLTAQRDELQRGLAQLEERRRAVQARVDELLNRKSQLNNERTERFSQLASRAGEDLKREGLTGTEHDILQMIAGLRELFGIIEHVNVYLRWCHLFVTDPDFRAAALDGFQRDARRRASAAQFRSTYEDPILQRALEELRRRGYDLPATGPRPQTPEEEIQELQNQMQSNLPAAAPPATPRPGPVGTFLDLLNSWNPVPSATGDVPAQTQGGMQGEGPTQPGGPQGQGTFSDLVAAATAIGSLTVEFLEWIKDLLDLIRRYGVA